MPPTLQQRKTFLSAIHGVYPVLQERGRYAVLSYPMQRILIDISTMNLSPLHVRWE